MRSTRRTGTIGHVGAGFGLAVALAGMVAQARMGDAPLPQTPTRNDDPPEPEIKVSHGYSESGRRWWFQLSYKGRVLEHVDNHTDPDECGKHCERMLAKWRKEKNLDAAIRNKARVRPNCSTCGGAVRGRGVTVGNDTFCGRCEP